MFCGLCKKECETTEEDNSFDYTDGRGTQTEQIILIVSSCCGNPVYWDEECTKRVWAYELSLMWPSD